MNVVAFACFGLDVELIRGCIENAKSHEGGIPRGIIFLKRQKSSNHYRAFIEGCKKFGEAEVGQRKRFIWRTGSEVNSNVLPGVSQGGYALSSKGGRKRTADTSCSGDYFFSDRFADRRFMREGEGVSIFRERVSRHRDFKVGNHQDRLGALCDGERRSKGIKGVSHNGPNRQYELKPLSGSVI